MSSTPAVEDSTLCAPTPAAAAVSNYDEDGLAEKYIDMKDRNPYFDADRRVLRALLKQVNDEKKSSGAGGVTSLVDLACGNGYYARMFKKEAESKDDLRVVGIDLSEQMIVDAKEIEEKDPLGIGYVTGDVNSAETVAKAGGPFDVCTASYLINYFDTEETLLEVLVSVGTLLKPGGSFIGLTLNPGCNLEESEDFLNRFGVCMEHLGGKTPADGSIVKVFISMCNDDDVDDKITLEVAYWSAEAYERLFEKAGFTLKWVALEKSPDQNEMEEGEEVYWDKRVSVAFIAQKND